MQGILGQSHALEVLRRSLNSRRVHHAWIFSGPKGVGKFTTAIEFARILLDPEAAPDLAGDVAASPDGKVSQLIDAGTHPDLHILRKELALYSDNPQLRERKLMSIPLDLLREHMLGGRTGDGRTHEAAAYRTPAMGHGKVFIIDEAEFMKRESQNALLKTLEEPSDHTYLFLITARPERMLPTIRSRCQHVRFNRLDPESMRQWFDQADLDIDEEERNWLVSFTDGAPGVGLLAAEFGFYQWRNTLQPMIRQLEQGSYPVEMGKAMTDLVGDFSEAWVKSHRNASKDAANKDGARHMFSLIASYARRRLKSSCADETGAEAYADLIDLVREAERQLDFNVNMRHLMDNLVVQWSRLGDTVSA